MTSPDLRQMRYVVEVAQQHSFSRAAERLHVAQQALSQQVKTVETQLGVMLFDRTNRGVELTPAGVVFVQEARRVIAAADRAVARTQAAARGDAGSVQLAYTLTSVYDTLPALVERVEAEHPDLTLDTREVLGGDLPQLLADGRFDVALCPRMVFGPGFERVEIRRERFVVAVSSDHRLAADGTTDLGQLAGELFELWPREMAPGFYDAVLAACRAAGFEPTLDAQAAGSTVWRNIARGRGVGLVVGSLIDQLPRGISLLTLGSGGPALILDLVWPRETSSAAVTHIRHAAEAVARERRWLTTVGD